MKCSSRARSISIVWASNEPIYHGIHESEDGGGGIEHGEVELFAETAHIGRQRNELEYEALDTAFVVFRVGMVEMRVSPALDTVSSEQLINRGFDFKDLQM